MGPSTFNRVHNGTPSRPSAYKTFHFDIRARPCCLLRSRNWLVAQIDLLTHFGPCFANCWSYSGSNCLPFASLWVSSMQNVWRPHHDSASTCFEVVATTIDILALFFFSVLFFQLLIFFWVLAKSRALGKNNSFFKAYQIQNHRCVPETVYRDVHVVS